MSETASTATKPLTEADREAMKKLALDSLRDWVEAELASGKPQWQLLAEMQAAIVETFGQ